MKCFIIHINIKNRLNQKGETDMLNRIEESEIFNTMVDYYDEYRPGYPREIINAVIDRAKLTAGSSILEIGCGSGKATLQFAGHGFELLGLDPGADLIKKGRTRINDKNIELVTSRFEDYPLQPDYFDAVISAQAFHWLPKPYCYELCAAALKSGRWLMPFWNIELIDETVFDNELFAIIDTYNAYISTMKTEDYHKKRVASIADEIIRSGFFAQPEVIQVYWEKTYTADEYFGYCMTGNVFIQNPKEMKRLCYNELAALAAKHNGIKRRYVCELYAAKSLK
jgi:SAM-dependent methyltransferase